MGPGQRTMAAPTLRQPRTRAIRLGSSSLPNRLVTAIIAGPRVSAAATTMTIPIANGTPRV
ncbi:Uncharacterised protein [Mycobacterium tuberculosis]|uniref:Uncharacterized protein n=1 Tax=Mycobacterium tuberculosis TaxID=1773 RepID=A0A654ZTQ3_MYCTX|nr:Uncharacterised protein [Mycobacterium tuberculosis]CKR22359.1 Uncharacterised protein [Mycobacterium tuberculosis]CKR41173.1 Uncharacterised protein [Mycobacterium tuberculosis]CKT28947.1 Uncharacterised protein [Mycobacterium tuberculosis]CNV34455.1 Uncharacterised protein [Mycobacterium tuberculosis]